MRSDWRGFPEDEGSRNVRLVVPADGVDCASLGDEVEEVGAAAEDDVLGVDGLVERGVRVGIGATADEGTTFEQGDGCAIASESDGCCEGRLHLLR